MREEISERTVHLNGGNNFKVVPTSTGEHRVYLNGEEVKHVKSFVLDVGVDRISTVTMEFNINDADVEMDFIAGEDND